MSTDIIVKVVPGGLMAANAIEAEKLEPLRGRQVAATLRQPRNIRFHRKYFALLGVGRDMADTELNAEQFRAYVTAGAGYCDFIEGKEGMVAVPRSISFAAMDEAEFARLYSDTLDFICRTWALDAGQVDQIVRFM